MSSGGTTIFGRKEGTDAWWIGKIDNEKRTGEW